jgi:hypothetical protein
MEQRTIRSSGAGRKRIIEKNSQIKEVFLEILADHTAGSPMQEDLKWTYLNQNTIVEKLSEKGHAISVGVVKQLLKKHDFKKRKAQKKIACGKSEFRDTQFCNIRSQNLNQMKRTRKKNSIFPAFHKRLSPHS